MLDLNIIVPRLTEKSYMLAAKGIYTFTAPTNLNRNQIADLVEQMFDVKVTSVKIVNQDGKAKKLIKNKRAFPGVRYDKDIKKAYVQLAEGQTIPVFEQGEETKDAKETK